MKKNKFLDTYISLFKEREYIQYGKAKGVVNSYLEDKYPTNYGVDFLSNEYYERFEKAQKEYKGIMKLFNEYYRKINVRWPEEKSNIKSIYTSSKKSNFDDFLIAFKDDFYVSHYNALYYHGLSLQRPKDIFLSNEVSGRGSVSDNKYEFLKVKLAHLKKARFSKNYLEYRNKKIYFLNKSDLGNLGLVEVSYNGVTIKISNPERTLYDSIISPQYSGGIGTLLECYKKYDIDLINLFDIYGSVNHFYPYWQRIGFFLSLINPWKANDWKEKFKDFEKQEFFFEHGFEEGWIYNDEWSLWHSGVYK